MSNIDSKEVERISYEIKMAGDIEHAKRVIKNHVTNDLRSCVTLSSTSFIYPGGVEEGFIVRFENYPRFPVEYEYTIEQRAVTLLKILMNELCETSAMLCSKEKAKWFFDRRFRSGQEDFT